MALSTDIQNINSDLQNKSQEILDDGLKFLGNLSELASSSNGFSISSDPISVSLDPDIDAPNTDTTKLNRVLSDISNTIARLNSITFPDTPELDDTNIVVNTDPKEAPEFNLPNEPTNPDINLNVSLPSEPILEDIVMPQEPDITIPDAPTFTDANIPDMPTLEPLQLEVSLPEFTADTPDISSFSYSEQAYTSDLKDKITSRLEINLDGGEPLPEQEMFDRAKERDQVVVNETINKAIDIWASRGFDLPSGMLDAELNKILLDYQNSKLDLSRDIAIEQAKARRENIHSAIQEGIKLEQANMQYATESLSRLLTASRYIADFSVQIYNLKVTAYNTQMERARTLLAIFSEKLKANLQKIEMYKSLLEGSKIETEVQNLHLKAYAYKIDTLKSAIQLYESKLNAVKTISDVNVAKIQQYKSLIDGYVSKLNAEGKKIDIYMGEVSAYKAKIDSYTSRVGAVESINRVKESIANIQLKKADLALQKNSSKVDIYKARIEANNTKVGAIGEQVRALGVSATAASEIEKAKMASYETKGKLSLGHKEIALEAAKENTQVSLETAKASMQAFIESQRIREQAAEGGSKIYAAMANAALSAINSAVSIAAKEVSTVSSDTSASY